MFGMAAFFLAPLLRLRRTFADQRRLRMLASSGNAAPGTIVGSEQDPNTVSVTITYHYATPKHSLQGTFSIPIVSSTAAGKPPPEAGTPIAMWYSYAVNTEDPHPLAILL